MRSSTLPTVTKSPRRAAFMASMDFAFGTKGSNGSALSATVRMHQHHAEGIGNRKPGGAENRGRLLLDPPIDAGAHNGVCGHVRLLRFMRLCVSYTVAHRPSWRSTGARRARRPVTNSKKSRSPYEARGAAQAPQEAWLSAA